MFALQPRMTRSHTASAPGPGSPHVVLAEDDASLRRVLAEVLRLRGFVVEEVADGRQLASTLEKARRGSPPDLLIADFGMPGVDGPDSLTHWAAARVPTLVMTSVGDAETCSRAHSRGAAAVMEMPFTLRELEAQIHVVLAPHGYREQPGAMPMGA